jgi:hypothetical protein
MKRNGTGYHYQFLTPQKLKNEILHQMHNSVLSGRLGKTKTKEKLSQRFFWFEMREDINIWIQQCEMGGAIKPPAKASRAPLGSNSSLVRNVKYLYPFGQIVSNSQNISIPSRGHWQWSQYISN